MPRLIVVIVTALLVPMTWGEVIWGEVIWAEVPRAEVPLELEGTQIQGGFVMGVTTPLSTLVLGDTRMRADARGRFVVGFGRDAPQRMTLSVRTPAGETRHHTLTIQQRTYKIQRIQGLPQAMVTPPAEVLARIRKDVAAAKAARSHTTDALWYRQRFVLPVQGTITGVYGSQRILNGTARRPHYGLDIAAPSGTPVRAPGAGIVRLAVPDMYYSGGTLILDHGHGVMSALLHLERLDVKLGARVEEGQILGTVGASGRATGPHLDWRVNWYGVRMDPQLWLRQSEP